VLLEAFYETRIKYAASISIYFGFDKRSFGRLSVSCLGVVWRMVVGLLERAGLRLICSVGDGQKSQPVAALVIDGSVIAVISWCTFKRICTEI